MGSKVRYIKACESQDMKRHQGPVPLTRSKTHIAPFFFHFAKFAPLVSSENSHQTLPRPFIFYNLLNMSSESMLYRILMLCLLTRSPRLHMLETRAKRHHKSVPHLLYMCVICQEMHTFRCTLQVSTLWIPVLFRRGISDGPGHIDPHREVSIDC